MVLHFKLLNGCDFCGSVLLVFMLFFFCERLSCWCFCSFWHVNCWMLTFSPTLRHFEVCKFLEYLNCLRAITILMFSRFLMSFIFLRAITSLVFLRFSWIFPFLRVAILVFLRFLNFVFFESNHRFGVFAVFKFLNFLRTNTIFGVFAAFEFLNFQRATTVLVVSRFLDRYLYILFKKLVNIQYVQCMCFVYNKHRILHRQTTTNVYHISVITCYHK